MSTYDRRRSLGRLLGVLLVVSAVCLNPWAVGQLLAPDEYIEDLSKRAAIYFGEGLLLLLGITLLIRGSRLPQTFVLIVGLTLATTSAVGTYGTLLWFGWLTAPVRDLPALCEWLAAPDVPYHGAGEIDRLESAVVATEAEPGQEQELVVLRIELADHLLRHGRVVEAVDSLETALDLALSHQMSLRDTQALRRWLGIAYLRLGEVTNCIATHNRESCLFPIRGQGVWQDQDAATVASQYLEEYLEHEPNDLGVRWLLGISYMTVARDPREAYGDNEFPESFFEEPSPARRFIDVAPDLGLGPVNQLGGAIMDDFDNDGFLDVITSTYSACEPLLFFRNSGDGSFSDVSAESGLSGQLGGFNLLQADANNDGLLDVLVLRGAWLGVYGRQRNSLLIQGPDGRFIDVTDEAGLGDVAYPTLGAAWADHDNDGDLDLYVANERLHNPLSTPPRYSPSQLFRNNDDGTFTDIAASAGVANFRNGKGVAWGDYDNDGDPDLFVANLGGPNRLYRNDGNGHFSDVAAEMGVDRHPPTDRSFASWFWDVNNDGWLDLFVAGYAQRPLATVVADYLSLPSQGERLLLYLNDGGGRLVDASEAMGISHIRMPMGANFGDLDNDGYLDFYLGTGAPEFDYLIPNAMYQNLGGERFVDVTAISGVGHLQKGHGIAWGDIDNDGDQDIYAQMGGFYPSDVFANALFDNPGFGNHWITLRLVGVQSNRFGVGARIRLQLDERENGREVHALVGSGGSFGASSLQQEIGVGATRVLEAIEVWWPASGIRQRFESVPVDQFIEITEGADTYRTLDRERLGLRPGR